VATVECAGIETDPLLTAVTAKLIAPGATLAVVTAALASFAVVTEPSAGVATEGDQALPLNARTWPLEGAEFATAVPCSFATVGFG
jgi:hypothetical protein